MKILIIRFSSIGDIVLTTPVIRCLKTQRPDVELHYLTKYQFSRVVNHNPYIDRVHFLQSGLNEIIPALKNEKFDFIVDLHNNLRSHAVIRALKVKHQSFDKLNFKKWLLTTLKINLMPDISIVDRYLDTLKDLNIKNDKGGLDFYLDEKCRLQNSDIPMSHHGGYVGCVIGGSYTTKKLPIDKWIEFCKNVPFPVVLLGGPEDKDEGNQIADTDPVKIYNSCGKFNLSESAELVKTSRVVVTNDTGLMHIAAAFKKPIISLWGNTVPEMGMFPYYGNNNLHTRCEPKLLLLENKRLFCRPCSKLGYDNCPLGHFKCMRRLDMDLAIQVVRTFWKN